MNKLTKKCILVFMDNLITICDKENSGICVVGKGYKFAEFDDEKELDKFINDNNLAESSQSDVEVIDTAEEAEIFIKENLKQSV